MFSSPLNNCTNFINSTLVPELNSFSLWLVFLTHSLLYVRSRSPDLDPRTSCSVCSTMNVKFGEVLVAAYRQRRENTTQKYVCHGGCKNVEIWKTNNRQTISFSHNWSSSRNLECEFSSFSRFRLYFFSPFLPKIVPLMNHHTIPKIGFGSGPPKSTNNNSVGSSVYLPKISTSNKKRQNHHRVSIELSHGNNANTSVSPSNKDRPPSSTIVLPSHKMDTANKKYLVTFSLKEKERERENNNNNITNISSNNNNVIESSSIKKEEKLN